MASQHKDLWKSSTHLSLLLIVLVAVNCIDADCTLPDGISNTYWHSYSDSDEVIVMELSGTTIRKKNTATNTYEETYTCTADIHDVSPYYYLVVTDDSGNSHCLELVDEGMVLFVRIIDADASLSHSAQCRNELDASTVAFDVLIKYDTSTNSFDIANGECASDFHAGDYRVTYEEEAGTVLCDDASVESEATISGNTLEVNSCSSTSTYYEPFTSTLKCLIKLRFNILHSTTPASNGDIVILSSIISGKQRFYCSHYHVDYSLGSDPTQISLSLAALDENSCTCNAEQEYISATIEDAATKAGYKRINFVANQCELLTPCLNSGVCNQDLGSYSCDCPAGYEGVHCESEINECMSQPCQNGGDCVDGLDSYTCTCPPLFAGTNCEIEFCEFPMNLRTVWALGYEVDFTGYHKLEFTLDRVMTQITPGAIDEYKCVEAHDEGDKTFVLTQKESDPTEQLCIMVSFRENVLLVNYLSADETVTASTGCIDHLQLNAPKIAYPVNATSNTIQLKQSSACPLMVGGYHATVESVATAGPVCENDATSVTTIDADGNVDINSCIVTPDPGTFDQPFNNYVYCVDSIPASIVDPQSNVGDDVVVLAYLDTTFNKYVFYCARYLQSGTGYMISFPVTEKMDSVCESGKRAEYENTAEYSLLTITSNMCDTGSRCENGGICHDLLQDFYCECLAGFDGEFCEIDIDECASIPCLNGGTCIDGANSYTCSCPPGLTGDLCFDQADECESQPCQNGGICLDRVNGYYCDCPPQWIWQNCEQPNDCANLACQNNGVCHDDLDNIRCDCPSGYNGLLCETQDAIVDPGYNAGNITVVAGGGEGLDQTSVILIIVFVGCSAAAITLLGFFLLCKTKPVLLY